ncbi:MAG: GNAT family N-acetyltransferase [Ferrimicrobium sp.]|uniref:bifunctional acetate--CoA ligase family protein/GNAT family N-acetyltransferase n=1 Tax=Ferrimicrobium sp. TaxID=2926050 RepID=UPI0026300267|nr:GNAT family N-acetyltransferase [Ferrimicrobium sp.]
MTPESHYPASWESDTILSDGRTVHLRPIRPSDAQGITELHARLSPATVYYRFFTPMPHLSEPMLNRFVNVDYQDRMAFVADYRGRLIAVARYDRIPGNPVAEVAFLVDDAHQGRGLGSIMLEQLAAFAKTNGITRFVADTLADNTRMLKVFRDAGYQLIRHTEEGVVQVRFDLTPTQQSRNAMAAREHRATARSIETILRPNSVAIVGASRVAGSVGDLIFANLLDGNFSGTIYPVNSEATAIRGVRCYPNLASLPEPVDLVIIAVNVAEVLKVIEDAITTQAKGVVIISAGFSDTSREGAEVERQLVALARRNGIRVVGPNSMGIATPPLGLQATLAPIRIHQGGAGVHAQSGPLSLAILAELQRADIGVSGFVSSGNKADISGNDLLSFWEDDPLTSVVLLYMEGFGNPRSFARIARRVSLAKPVLAVKSRRRREGQIPLAFGELDDDAAVEALMRQTGVIRLDTLEQLIQLTRAFLDQPIPNGNRVAILTNTGGTGPLVADALTPAGLELATFSSAAPTVGTKNPIELAPSATPADWGHHLAAVLADTGVDAAIVCYIPTVVGSNDDPRTLAPPTERGLSGNPNPAVNAAASVADAIARAAAEEAAKPVLANFLALPGVPAALSSHGNTIPSYSFPESAAIALGRMADYSRWRLRPSGEPITTEPLVVPDELLSTLAAGSALLDGDPARIAAGQFGIPIDPPTGARREELEGRTALLRIELIHDNRFGPFLRGSLSGVAFDLFGAASLRALPQTEQDIEEFINSIPGITITDGYAKLPKMDRSPLFAITKTLVAIADQFYPVHALLLDPISLTTKGVYVRGARMLVRDSLLEPQMVTRSLRAPGALH